MIIPLIARLLDYPEAGVNEHRSMMIEVVRQSSLSVVLQDQLVEFICIRCDSNLFDWQEEYDGLFERGRSLSLLIYEHIYGESRDRGQAMVDLQQRYHEAGLYINQHELPDYLPMYLEFVHTQTDFAHEWLADIAPVLGLLATRLEQRRSDYSILMYALLALSQVSIDTSSLQDQVALETRDDTPEALDLVWEEEAISFGGDAISGGCPSQEARQEQPIHWATQSDHHQTRLKQGV